MSRWYFICFAALFAVSPSVHAAHGDTVTFEGRISKIEFDQITLLVDGKPVIVPRSSIPKYYTISYMNSVVAYLPTKDFMKIRKPANQK